MGRIPLTFKDLLEAGAKPYADLWRDDSLNLNALARFYGKKGFSVSAASFSRILSGKQALGESVVDATHSVLGIPKSMLRGEPMSAEVDKILTDYKFSTLLLAKRIEQLPKEDYHMLVQQLERAEESASKLRHALQSGGVTPIDRARKA